eukprot:2333056-Lingulodinium_polyedra.AAC.1
MARGRRSSVSPATLRRRVKSMHSSPSPNAGANASPYRRNKWWHWLAPKQDRATRISTAASAR